MVTHILHNVITFQFELPCLKIDKTCYIHNIIPIDAYPLLHNNFISIFSFSKINNYHSNEEFSFFSILPSLQNNQVYYLVFNLYWIRIDYFMFNILIWSVCLHSHWTTFYLLPPIIHFPLGSFHRPRHYFIFNQNCSRYLSVCAADRMIV